jgi:hypothetical protein
VRLEDEPIRNKTPACTVLASAAVKLALSVKLERFSSAAVQSTKLLKIVILSKRLEKCLAWAESRSLHILRFV